MDDAKFARIAAYAGLTFIGLTCMLAGIAVLIGGFPGSPMNP